MPQEPSEKFAKSEQEPTNPSEEGGKSADVILKNADNINPVFLKSVFDKEVIKNRGDLNAERQALAGVASELKDAGRVVAVDVKTSGQGDVELIEQMAKEWKELAEWATLHINQNIHKAIENFDIYAAKLDEEMSEERKAAQIEQERIKKKKVIEDINSLELQLKEGKNIGERMDAADKLMQKMEELKQLLDDLELDAVARQKLDSLSWNDNKEIADRAMEIMSEKAKSIMKDFDETVNRTRKLDFAPAYASALVELWLSVAKHKDDEGNNILIDDHVDLIYQQRTLDERKGDYSCVYAAVSELVRYKDSLVPGMIEIVREVLKMKSGADIDSKQLKDLIKAWQLTANENPDPAENAFSTRWAVYENLKALASLEFKQPGISKELTKDFGIRDFVRYPEEMLLEQIKQKDNTELPYGIVLLPQSDHNGAFYSLRRGLGEMFVKLNGKYNIIAVEAGSIIEVGKRLSKLEKLHTQNGQIGPARKISFAYIGGHGTENSIQFGENGDLSRLNAKHLGGRGVRRSHKFFEKNPTIILASCSTGAKSGIGQQLSEAFGANVIAPNEPAAIDSVGVDFDDSGKPIFSISYVNAGLPGSTLASISYNKGELGGIEMKDYGNDD